MVKIVPAILAKNFTDFRNQVKLFEKYFNFAQIDVMDNKFVKNKTFFDFNKIKKLKTSLNYELHLMVNDPLKIVKDSLGFKKVKKIIVHIEAVDQSEALELIKYIKKNKVKAGLAINPETSLLRIRNIINKIDYLLVMGVTPGKSGQKIKKNIYQRIRFLKKHYPKLKIGVDGGVNERTVTFLKNAGVDVINSASYLLKSKDIVKTAQVLMK